MSLNQNQGITCIIISHKLHELTQISNRITVLRDGMSIETLNRGDERISEDRIIKNMVGRELTNRFPERSPKIGEVVFEVQNWTVHDPLDEESIVIENVNFKLRKGEIVGFSGLMGGRQNRTCHEHFRQSVRKEYFRKNT